MLAGAALIALTAAAGAASYDGGTGFGHVSAGELSNENEFGKEVLVPANAEMVVFTQQRVRTWASTCQKNGTAITKDVVRKRVSTTLLTSDVEVSNQGKVTGWDLTGRVNTTVVGTFCPDGWSVIQGPKLVRISDYILRAEYENQIVLLKIVNH